jgi:hypothetical protein
MTALTMNRLTAELAFHKEVAAENFTYDPPSHPRLYVLMDNAK